MDRSNGGGAIFLTALTSASKSSGFDPQKATPGSLALINIAIDVLTVDISRPAETELGPLTNAQNIIRQSCHPRRTVSSKTNRS